MARSAMSVLAGMVADKAPGFTMGVDYAPRGSGTDSGVSVSRDMFTTQLPVRIQGNGWRAHLVFEGGARDGSVLRTPYIPTRPNMEMLADALARLIKASRAERRKIMFSLGAKEI